MYTIKDKEFDTKMEGGLLLNIQGSIPKFGQEKDSAINKPGK